MDLNQVIIYGRVGKEPELRNTPGGDAVTNFSVANSTFKKKSNGEWEEKTSWFDVSLFGNSAKAFCERTKKGDRVTVVGNLKQDTWEDKDGNRRERVSIIGRAVQYHEKKPKTGDSQQSAEPAPQTDDVPF